MLKIQEIDQIGGMEKESSGRDNWNWEAFRGNKKWSVMETS